jgi:NAD(P)-dependent dehydrogenase (short-subunit alcohol dehydrogenase family)
MDKFEDKVAFVTGGASGIGLGMVKAFLGADMKVVVADIKDSHLSEFRDSYGDNPNVHAIRLDVTDRSAMAAAARETVERFGAVHVLCNNAGVGVIGPVTKAKYGDWDWAMGVNLGGVINGVHEFLPHILEHGEGGHIVNTASMAALMPIPNCVIYITAKAAVVGLSECLYGELAPLNVGVSAFCPGPVQSNIGKVGELRPEASKADSGLAEMDDWLGQREPSKNWMSIEEVGERVLEGIRNNEIFILTHPEFKEGVAERLDAILEAFPDEPINQVRASEITMLTSNSIYKP